MNESDNNVICGPLSGVPASVIAPSNLAAVAVSSSQIDLSWQDNSDNETGFRIWRKTESAGTYAQIATSGAGVASYQDTGLAADTTYYYEVNAYNASMESAHSNEAAATTAGNPPPVNTPHSGTWNGSIVSFNVSSDGGSLTSAGSSLVVSGITASFTVFVSGSNCSPLTIFSTQTYAIINNSFNTSYIWPDGSSVIVSGQFTSSTTASGTYMYSGIGSECSGSGTWSTNF